jgi:hypothetical protein
MRRRLVLLLCLAGCRDPARDVQPAPEVNSAILIESGTSLSSVEDVPQSASASATEPAPIPSTKIPDRVRLDLSGTYVHPGSAVAFPEEAAFFTRVEPYRYDAEGNDVGIGYRRIFKGTEAQFRVEATLFVFPSPRDQNGNVMSFEEQFAGEVAQIHQAHAEVREIRRVDREATRAGRSVHLRAAEFTFRQTPQMGGRTTVTVLAAFLDGPWHVTYRVTLPIEERELCLSATDDLLTALGLPQMKLPNASQPR